MEFFHQPANWAAIGFVVFVALVAKRAWVAMTAMLDGRAAEIKAKLDDAVKLREDAKQLLANYEKKVRDAEKEATDILAQAKAEATRMAQDAAVALETTVQRRSELAMDRIARAEQKALKEVRDVAIEIAVRGAERLIAAEVDDKKADKMVDDAIKDLDRKLH